MTKDLVMSEISEITTLEQYQKLYNDSLENTDKFWEEQANKFISWNKKWDKVSDCNFEIGKINWFKNAKLNACYNCVDRHLLDKENKTAIIWEGNNPNDSKKITYKQLFEEVSKLAYGLKELGIKSGDVVCIYMPMIPEAIYAMLACARIGAIHSVVFGGFSSEALSSRIIDSNCKLIITADEGIRGDKKIFLKNNVDQALENVDFVVKTLVVKYTNNKISWDKKNNYWYHELVSKYSSDKIYNSKIESFDSENPLFILYTSGSTGKPKGILHTTGGYLLYAAMTHKYIFDYKDNDIYWCTADIGWITGHSYLVYGPLANGATILMYEGVPMYPTPARTWEIIDKHNVNIFYTAPTLLRSLMAKGDEYLQTTSRKSLKVLGSVGELINPTTWDWYYNSVGNKNCPIVDTWWQTETGGILISPLPGIKQQKPGSCGFPFFGIKPKLEKNDYLLLEKSWPGQARTIYNDHARFVENYFSEHKNCYFAGDAAKKDDDGFYWIKGRVDDVINVSGHRISTQELEDVLVSHEKVVEASVVGAKHSIKGECVYAYVRAPAKFEAEIDNRKNNISTTLESELKQLIKNKIGSFAVPDVIHWVHELPKTRSGKIMRRILRKIANKEFDNLGDLSTLTDRTIIDEILQANAVAK